MIKIIFLDIDGILNSHKWWDYYNENELSKDTKYDFDLDPQAIETLNSILDSVPSVKIVITSTWRFDFKDTVERLQAQGLRIPILDRTSVEPRFHEGTYMPRGVLVKKWLSEHTNGETCNYVIFDDDMDFLLDQAYNLIITDTAIGITQDNVSKAIGILGRDRGTNCENLLKTQEI